MQKKKEQNNEYSSDWIPYIEEVKRYRDFAQEYYNKSLKPYYDELIKYQKYANRFFDRDTANQGTKESANERDKNS